MSNAYDPKSGRASVFYRDSYARVARWVLYEVIILLLLILAIMYIVFFPPKPEYFLTTTGGTTMPLPSVN